MIKTLVVDDERLARQEMKKMLAEFPEIEVIGEAQNADEAQKIIESNLPDLVFLDIQMPGRNGFELLESLEKVPDVIFVTAYDDFALKAFEVSALDYIVKPVEENRLKESVQRVIEHQQEQSPMQNSREQLGENDQVFVKDGEKCWFVQLKDVRLFESEGNYVKVYFENNKPMILRSLNTLDKKLDDHIFFRANRKHIINLRWIEKTENWFNGGLRVWLRGGDKIEISRRQASKLKEMMSL